MLLRSQGQGLMQKKCTDSVLLENHNSGAVD